MYPDEFHVDIDFSPNLKDDNWLKQYDIIHYHRTLGPYEEMEELNNRLRKLNIVSILDIDDFWAPGQHHPAYILMKQAELDKKISNNLRLAQYVTTTTPIFAKEISKLNKNVFVLPNSIDPTEKQWIPNPTASDRIRITWLGGSSHRVDLELLKGVVQSFTNDGLLDKVQFVLCGFDLRGNITMVDQKTGKQTSRAITPMESVWYEYEKIFTNNYTSISDEYRKHLLTFKNEEYPNVSNEPYRRVWTKHISSYATNYNHCDISLAPLAENTFNFVKSQLKVIEAGFYNKAIVAQDFGPYQIDLKNAYIKGEHDDKNFDENGNAYLVESSKNHKQWYQHLKRLVLHPERIKILADNLSAKIKKEYSIEATTIKRRDLYLKLVNENKKVVEELAV